MSNNIIHKEESYAIVGVLYEVYNNLGGGFSEIVYKDALEYEFKELNISFKREMEFNVTYKETVLPHKFYADFVVFDTIILEIKSVDYFHNKHISQCINYLKVSQCKLAILANFQKDTLKYKRIVL